MLIGTGCRANSRFYDRNLDSTILLLRAPKPVWGAKTIMGCLMATIELIAPRSFVASILTVGIAVVLVQIGKDKCG